MSVFDETALLRSSEAQVGDADFGDPSFFEPLRVLLAALQEEAGLERMGEWAAVARLITALNKRRRLSQLLRANPQVRELEIEAPIFILGFPRTGTTLLHNLLASDPNNRALRLWEMREPFMPADAPADWVESSIATTAQLVQAAYQLSPRLVDIHPLRPTWPDECSWLFRNSFTSMVFGFSYYIPSYVGWLSRRDAGPDYAYFRLQLQAILSQRPGQPLVLKDPCHIWNLDALLANFPDARVIQLHRPIEQVVASFCSLCRALQEGGARPRSLAEIGAYASSMLETGMQRVLAARAGIAADRVLDLDYRDLVGDPLGTTAKIYGRLGLEFADPARAAMGDWLDRGRALAGNHHYSLEMFGLDPAATQRRFAAYTDRFTDFTNPK